ncbi:A-factor biosynthesis protein [Streptomyces sp. NBC_01116]
MSTTAKNQESSRGHTSGDPSRLAAYTHLHHQDSVLVTNWGQIGPDLFAVSVRWPPLSCSLPYDPRLVAQTVRQCGLTLAHAEYGVPLSHQTLLNSLEFALSPELRASPARTTPLRVLVDVTRAGRALHMRFRILHGEVTVARAEAEFGWVSPAVYRRLRGEHATVDWGVWPLPAPVAPSLLGRRSETEVAIAATERPRRWQLRNDVRDLHLFDHPVDHVPGLALLEAADQVARAVLGPDPVMPSRVSVSYLHYVEFDEPCWLEATLRSAPGSRSTVRVSGVQGGVTKFHADILHPERNGGADRGRPAGRPAPHDGLTG